MYYGLWTFDSKTLCEKALGVKCNVDSDCPEQEPCMPYESCIKGEVKCVNGRCGIALRSHNLSNCPSNTSDENGKCMFNYSNGRRAEIKIMPETASAKAIERLGELGFTIQLKEVGKGAAAKLVYELTGNKEGKFLGIFKITASERVQVDAETGEIKKLIKPWWSFLASGI